MWWTNPLCDSAEDLGTLAENEPPTTDAVHSCSTLQASEQVVLAVGGLEIATIVPSSAECAMSTSAFGQPARLGPLSPLARLALASKLAQAVKLHSRCPSARAGCWDGDDRPKTSCASGGLPCDPQMPDVPVQSRPSQPPMRRRHSAP